MIERLWKQMVFHKRFSGWTLVALFCWPLAWLYRLGFWLVRQFAGAPVSLGVPVISIGNITVGGTGKTPTIEFIARGLLNEGYKVGIVSRGYGRASHETVVEPGYKIQRMEVGLVGDEVKYLANSLPEAIFSVDDSKTEAGLRLVESEQLDLVLVDDGFQHCSLKRDIDLVTYDAALPERALKLFPRGVMREPLGSLKRADIVILTRSDFATDIHNLRKRLIRKSPRAEFYLARFTADELVGRENRWPVKYLEDKSIYLFAGIGNFLAFKKQVGALSADIDAQMELADHQEYTSELLGKIKSEAVRHDSDLLLTTGKDWVKLGDYDFGREVCYLNQIVDLDPGEEKLISRIKTRLALRDTAY